MAEKPDVKNDSPVIKCESVYKIFGNNAKKLLENSQGEVDAKTFQEAGCIVGVNKARLKSIKEKC